MNARVACDLFQKYTSCHEIEGLGLIEIIDMTMKIVRGGRNIAHKRQVQLPNF